MALRISVHMINIKLTLCSRLCLLALNFFNSIVGIHLLIEQVHTYHLRGFILAYYSLCCSVTLSRQNTVPPGKNEQNFSLYSTLMKIKHVIEIFCRICHIVLILPAVSFLIAIAWVSQGLTTTRHHQVLAVGMLL